MKSSMTPTLALVVGVALLALAATHVQATGPGKLSVKLTAYQRDEMSINGSVLTERIDKVKVTTKDLLALIEEYGEVTVPAGAYIEVDDEGGVTLLDKDGNIIPVANLSSLLEVGYGPAMFAGKTDFETGKENTKGIFPMSVGVVTGVEDSIELQGLAKEKYSLSDTTKSTITESTSITANVTGGGSVDGEFTLVEGSVGVKGKQKFVD